MEALDCFTGVRKTSAGSRVLLRSGIGRVVAPEALFVGSDVLALVLFILDLLTSRLRLLTSGRSADDVFVRMSRISPVISSVIGGPFESLVSDCLGHFSSR